MIKLWLDDVRDPPDDSWTIARTAKEAIGILETGDVREASLDHDLGMVVLPATDGTVVLATECLAPSGYEVAVYIEQMASTGHKIPGVVKCHSANPVGKQRIEAALRSARSRA